MQWFIVAAVATSALVLQQPLVAQQRLKVPSRDAQQAAVERIQGVFADEYKANNREARAKLAGQLADLGGVEKDTVARFALYREAVRLASENGDVDTCIRAIEAMEANYELNVSAVTSYALVNLAKSVQGNEPSETLAGECERFALVLIDENRFEEAKKILGYGYNAARRIRGSQQAAALREMAEHVDAIAKDFKAVEQYAAALKDNPDDAVANLEIGRFECFVKGNWNSGLRHLAKGSDPGLKKLAETTLAGPSGAQEKFQIADGWWKQGESLPGVSRQRVQGYASRLYSEALPGLTGLNKVTAEKRIAAVTPSSESSGRATVSASRGPKTINLLELLDPAEDFKPRNKWALADGVLQCTEGHFVPKVVFPYQPPEEYDVMFSFAQPSLRNGAGVLMPNPDGKSSFSFSVGGGSGREFALSNEQGKYIKRFPNAAFLPNVRYTVLVKVRKAGVQAYINGAQVLNLPTDFSDLKVGSWHRINEVSQLALFCDDKTVFYEAQVTELTGEGTLTRTAKQQ